MKKTILNSICLLLFAAGIWQCTPKYNLVDYKEIHYFGSNKTRLDRHTRYFYKDGILSSKTDARWEGSDTTVTEYEIIRYDDRIDTIETNHYSWANDTAKETYRTIKTCDLNGVRMKTVYCELSDSGWIESGGYLKYDSAGRLIENVSEGQFYYWYSYDTSGNFSGRRYEFVFKGKTSYYRDTVIFTDDKLDAVYTENICDDEGNIMKTKNMTLYKLDKHGRIIQKECVDPDETDSVFLNLFIISYQYNRKGKLKSETTSGCSQGETDFRLEHKTEYRYHRGLITWQLNYDYMDGRWQLYSIYRYKYDYRHKLPLERTLHSENYQDLPNNLLIFIGMMTDRVEQRLVWTYEKAK
jgi:YD repeat-containing protein